MMRGVLCLLLVATVFMAISSARDCTSSDECNTEECCVEYFPYFKSCRDKPDDVGDVCLGQFNCDCKQGLKCKPHEPSIFNFVKIGAGTCVNK